MRWRLPFEEELRRARADFVGGQQQAIARACALRLVNFSLVGVGGLGSLPPEEENNAPAEHTSRAAGNRRRDDDHSVRS